MAPRTPRDPRAAELRGVLEAIAEETARLPGPALDAIRPVLQQAQRELDRDLRAWVASGRSGARYTPQAYRSSILSIQAALGTIQSLQPTLFQVLLRWAGATGLAARLARSHTAREFLMFEGRPVLMPTVPVRLAADLATGGSSPLERYFATTAKNYSAEVLRDVHRELAVGVVRGENTDSLIARLMATGRAAERNGLLGGAWLGRAEYRAERVVRTELAAAYNRELDETYREVLPEFPDLLRRWDAHADARLCERCQELHGRTINPSKGETFPNGAEGPPLHPNCRCRADLWRDEWSRLIAGGKPGVALRTAPPPPAASPAPAPAASPAPAARAAPAAPPRRPRVPEMGNPGFAPRPPAPGWGSFAEMPIQPGTIEGVINEPGLKKKNALPRGFRQAAEEALRRLTPAELRGAEGYTGPGYRLTNMLLRQGREEVAKLRGASMVQVAEGMAAGMRRAVEVLPKATREMVVFRGATFTDRAILDTLASAGEFTLPGFTSSTLSPDVALGFSRGAGPGEFSVVYRIRNPVNGALIPDTLNTLGEGEVVFPPGTRFRVVARARVGENALLIDVEPVL